MDPNATIREMAANDAALAEGEITRRQWSRDDIELWTALRDWRDRGGFPPSGGWPRGL